MKEIEESVRESKKLLTNKILFSCILIFVQMLFVFFLFVKIYHTFKLMVFVFKTISVLAAIYIVSKDDDDSGYKITWLILICVVPFVGGILYLFLGDKKPGKKLQKSFDVQMKEVKKYKTESQKINDPYVQGQMNYLNMLGFPTCKGEEIQYYSLGDYAFEPMLNAIKKAKKYIFLQYFIVAEGYMLESVLDILKQKVQEGVEVRFMYDDLGCLTMLPRNYYKELEKMGIKATAFNPFVPFLSLVMNNRDHKKIVVVDGEIAFVGGFNLADEYINKKVKYGHWKDSGLMITGEAVWTITCMFLTSWNVARHTKESYLPYLREYQNVKQADGYLIPYTDSPLDNERCGETVYLNMINQATKYLYISTPYLILDDGLMNALVNASKRGVDVRIITPGIPDKKIVFRVTRSYYQTLMKSGIRIYEYTPGFIHAKNFLCDDIVGTVGTINLDYRSLYLHFENGVYLYNNSCLQDMKTDFINTFSQCYEMTLDEVITGKFKGLLETILRIIAPLL